MCLCRLLECFLFPFHRRNTKLYKHRNFQRLINNSSTRSPREQPLHREKLALQSSKITLYPYKLSDGITALRPRALLPAVHRYTSIFVVFCTNFHPRCIMCVKGQIESGNLHKQLALRDWASDPPHPDLAKQGGRQQGQVHSRRPTSAGNIL